MCNFERQSLFIFSIYSDYVWRRRMNRLCSGGREPVHRTSPVPVRPKLRSQNAERKCTTFFGPLFVRRLSLRTTASAQRIHTMSFTCCMFTCSLRVARFVHRIDSVILLMGQLKYRFAEQRGDRRQSRAQLFAARFIVRLRCERRAD